MWQWTLDGATPEQMSAFFDSLSHFGLSEQARSMIAPRIVNFLKKDNVDSYNDEMEQLIRDIADSFGDKRAEAEYFAAIMEQRPNDTSLAGFLLDESLIDDEHSDVFFHRLILQNDVSAYGDSDFNARI